jgi:hypothetical protein
MAPRGSSPRLRRGGLSILAPVLALMLMLALSAAPHAADYDGDGPGYTQEDDREVDGGRKSTWELNTSLTFYRYLEPFPRVDSARVCRDRCASNRRCAGWTYYDANFNDAGRYSYKLQRLCVLGAGVKNKQSGNRPGRTSGVLRAARQDGGGSGDD